MMDFLTQILHDTIVECGDDYVGLWVIVKLIRDKKTLSDSTVFSYSMEIVEHILEHPEIVAGQYEGDEFREWDMPKDKIIERIEREWAALGRDPTLGEIVWFVGAWARRLGYAFN
jgi:hypothetical protein